MREFSANEREIIIKKLVGGTVFTDLFPNSFLNDAKFEIEIDKSEDGFSRFLFVSEKYSPEQGSKELVDMVNLLQFLLLNGLISKYPPIGFNSSDYDAKPSFILGNEHLTPGKNKNVRRTLLAGFPKEVVDFINAYWYYQFEATEPLKSLASHGFKSLEERMHRQNIGMAIAGNVMAVLIALAGIFLTYFQNDDVSHKVENLEQNVGVISQSELANFASIKILEREIEALKKEIIQLQGAKKLTSKNQKKKS